MRRAPGPHDFLLYLRGRCPALARRLDGLQAMERRGGRLVLRLPEGSWALRELHAREDLLRTEVRRLFGPATEPVLEAGPADAEALPFPVLASKIWNHLAFWAQDGPRALVLAVRKDRYRERWLPRTGDLDTLGAEATADPEVSLLSFECSSDLPAGERPATWLLPEVLDRLCALARAEASYVHLLLPFPGDPEAERLEGRLYGVKEWGTPTTPGPVLQKYIGRLHYVAPDVAPLGHRLAGLLLRSPTTDTPSAPPQQSC